MHTYDTPAPVSAVVDIVFGSVRFVAGDRATTVVEVTPADSTWDLDVKAARDAEIDFSDGRLTVKHRQMRLANLFQSRHGRVDVVVELPAGSDVQGTTASGSFTVEGAAGAVRLKTPTGDVRVERAASLRVRTVGGDVTVGHVTGDADVSGNGAIRLDRVDGDAVVKNIGGTSVLGEIGGDLRVNSANGDITVGAARGTVNVKTASGDLRLGEIGTGPVELYTPNGDVEIGVPHGTAVALDARATAGRVREYAGAVATTERTVKVRARTHGGDITINYV
ncbi:hypothetical protein Afil01_14330 [Actinorhabdospora filicis]|uniref:DUF4097 domain-containing protein n=1 Tax=Actinorhabdospora filicis TaxID=1785913 RepID=A0A9W6W8M1_9ACTN|nr:DUF4097 family beta strand repeat-containing protein [Actinorhabdospora filicis]GLZ76626.1 hypothetical protein Afil01_14330 [Actinorhabdospora filicis]